MKRWACVARLGGLGDNLIAASVLAPLKRLGYMVDVVTAEPNHVVFYHNPHVDKLSVKNSDRDLPKISDPAWYSWFQSRAQEYDLFVPLSHSCENRHALFPMQEAFWWRPEYRRRLCAGSYLETVHDIAGVPHEFGPLFYPSEEETDHARATKAKMGGRVVAWVLSGSRIDKLHPYSAMAVASILREFDVQVMLIGAPNERQFSSARAIMEHVERDLGSSSRIHLAMTAQGGAQWPIRRSLVQVQVCDLVIGPDTGIMWSVATEPVPKIALMSHASAENITMHWVNTTTLHADQNRVPCWPCHRLHNDPSTCVPTKKEEGSDAGRTGAACMADISVADILQNVRKILQ
jgi:ADP-heptose:LPS heptosyltransferase